MTVKTSFEPGTFCWIDLGTTDSQAAKSFYEKLFGWTSTDNPAGPDMVYTMLQKDGKDVGALYEMGQEMTSQGVPPHWSHYIAVANADEAAAKVEELGGVLMMEPFDVMDVGRMALIQDPTGATFAAWETKKHFGASLVNEPGSMCWNELATRDTDAAKDFYTGLFGWDTQHLDTEGGPYTLFTQGGAHVAGMLNMTEDWGEIPPHWMIYFAVEDCDKSSEVIKELGGQVHHGPADIPDVGRFAVCADPQGAAFTIIKLINEG